MSRTSRRLAAVPAIGLAALAVALTGVAIAGSPGLPDAARSLVHPPKGADLVAPAPEGLSSVTVTRDWQEVDTSGSKRPPR